MAESAEPVRTVENDEQVETVDGPVTKYRHLHASIMESAVNYHAAIALAAMVMARAQGRIQRGPNIRRQAILAMAQGLFSAGHPHTLNSLQMMFSDMHRAGMFTVERITDHPRCSIVDIDFVLPKRIRKKAPVKYQMFTLNWSRRTSGDIETFPILAMSVTPQPPEDISARAAASREREAALRRERQALADEAAAAEASVAAQAAPPVPAAAPVAPAPPSTMWVNERPDPAPQRPPMRSYWADDRADGHDAVG